MIRDWRRALLVTGCAAYAIVCLAAMPPRPITAPDSQTYLAFSPIVPAGYPAFLRLVGARGAEIAQPLIYAAALAWLAVETLLATASLAPAAAVVVAALAIPGLADYHASILTESLFMSTLVAFLASVVRFVRTPTARSAAATAAIAGLSATLRSTGVAFLPVLIVMVGLQRRRFAAGNGLTLLLAATVPLLALASGERLAARAIHGDRLISLTGRHLFAKAGLIEAPPPPRPAADPLISRLEQQLDTGYAPIRALIARAPRDNRAVLTLYYETCLQGPCLVQLGESRPGTEDPALAAALARTARERIFRAPLNFAGVTATDYASLWMAYKQRHPETATALNAFLASNRPLPFEREAFRLDVGDTPSFRGSAAVRWLQPVVWTLGWITGALALLGLVAAVGGRSLPPLLSVACLASLTAHAGLLFSATFAAGIARFIVSLWPAVTTGAVFAVWQLCSDRSAGGGGAVLQAPGVGLRRRLGFRIEHLDAQIFALTAEPDHYLAFVLHHPAARVVRQVPEHAGRKPVRRGRFRGKGVRLTTATVGFATPVDLRGALFVHAPRPYANLTPEATRRAPSRGVPSV